MKIVLYNYVQPFEKNTPGGGVSIYLQNLTNGLRSLGHEVYTLSSGDRYTIFRHTPILKVNHHKKEIIIYNSPNVAPAFASFYHQDIYLANQSLNHIPAALRLEIGKVDIFHFHNIEGLTKEFFLSLKNEFYEAAIIYSAHNYNILCPQVNLWKNDSVSCVNFEDGHACTACINAKDLRLRKLLINVIKTPIKDIRHDENYFVKTTYYIETYITKLMRRIFSNDDAAIKRTAHRSNQFSNKSLIYENFRRENVWLMNHVFNKIIAVSQRTADILATFGVHESKLDIVYIGTKHCEKFNLAVKKTPTPDNVHIAYLGYMKKEKGFFFFLDALDSLPDTVTTCIDVTIAARFSNSEGVHRMRMLRRKVRSLRAFDGFQHHNLSEILEPVNLGIVPPLWEDNLPQIAIEFVSNGIPILTSDKGGAQEISGSSQFVFSSRSTDDLVRQISQIVNGTSNIASFWDKSPHLKSIAEHTADIVDIYSSIQRIHHCI